MRMEGQLDEDAMLQMGGLFVWIRGSWEARVAVVLYC